MKTIGQEFTGKTPENNWGTHTTGGYDLSGATKITFWAKGEKGGEQIEFFAGGITGDNPDSLEKNLCRNHYCNYLIQLMEEIHHRFGLQRFKSRNRWFWMGSQ